MWSAVVVCSLESHRSLHKPVFARQGMNTTPAARWLPLQGKGLLKYWHCWLCRSCKCLVNQWHHTKHSDLTSHSPDSNHQLVTTRPYPLETSHTRTMVLLLCYVRNMTRVKWLTALIKWPPKLIHCLLLASFLIFWEPLTHTNTHTHRQTDRQTNKDLFSYIL